MTSTDLLFKQHEVSRITSIPTTTATNLRLTVFTNSERLSFNFDLITRYSQQYYQISSMLLFTISFGITAVKSKSVKRQRKISVHWTLSILVGCNMSLMRSKEEIGTNSSISIE